MSVSNYYNNREMYANYGERVSGKNGSNRMYRSTKKNWDSQSDAHKSIHARFSDGTSCYGTETSTSSAVWTEDDDILHIPAYIKYDMPSYKNPQPGWQKRDERMQISSDMNKSVTNNKHRKSIGYDSENSSEIDDYKNTVLSEFLKDLDKIAECRMERDVRSEDGNSNASYDDSLRLSVSPSPQRWFVLILICISIGVRSFVSVVFGQINDIFSTYFEVGPDAVDWLTNTGSLASLLAIIVLIICGGKVVKLRMLCIFMTSTAALSTILLTAAMTNRKYGYMLGIAGQVALGLNNAVAMSIAPMTAATWFPDGQIATAISAPLVSVGIGEALGSYIPGVVVFAKEFLSIELEGSGGSGDEETVIVISPETEDSIRYRLVALFGIPAAISLFVFIISVIFFNERPELPPSEAQALIRERSFLRHRMGEAEKSALVSVSRSSVQANSFMNPSGAIGLLKNKSFILVTFVYGVVAASASSSVTLLSSMLPYMEQNGSTDNADGLSGRIMSVLWICFIIGPFITGLLLDKTHRYREIAMATLIGLTAGSVGVPISFYMDTVKGLYLSHALIGFFMGAAETTMFEIAAEITYPSPELTFASILNISWVVFFVIYPVAGRIILNRYDAIGAEVSAAASVCPAVFTAVAALLTLFCLRPTYRRQTSNYNQTSKLVQQKSDERTPLLQNI